jgi:hypothetical protein
MTRLRALLLTAIMAGAGFSTTSALHAEGISWDGSKPAPGQYFYWYEPSFYAGFAPRSQDPSRFHIELSRGNQIRFTMVLGPEEMDTYLDDLLVRLKTYQELIDGKIIKLSVNNNYERFAEKIDQLKIADFVATRSTLDEKTYRATSIKAMGDLNPGKVFYIHIPVAKLFQDWHAALLAAGENAGSGEAQLDLANAILPGRVNATSLSDAQAANIAMAVDLAKAGGADSAEFSAHAVTVLNDLTKGHYVIREGHVDAIEYTHILPAGTVKAFSNTKHGKLPGFGVTGVWNLMERAQGRGITGMVDYLSSNPGYGFIPLLAYQHAGGVYYNAFHNAGIRSPVGTRYFPKEWRKVASERDPKKNYQNLWLVSRGPASHGCTRLDSGQMSEMRHALPSATEKLSGIPTFRNLPECYDVFDVNGDGKPEVMGVQYYVAYVSKGHKPVKPWAPNTRKPYYAWLYGENISYNSDGSAAIKDVPICRFIGKHKAKEAAVLKDIPLYEAAFEPGPIQFYTVKPVSFESRAGMQFNRELRRVSGQYEADRKKLFLK